MNWKLVSEWGQPQPEDFAAGTVLWKAERGAVFVVTEPDFIGCPLPEDSRWCVVQLPTETEPAPAPPDDVDIVRAFIIHRDGPTDLPLAALERLAANQWKWHPMSELDRSSEAKTLFRYGDHSYCVTRPANVISSAVAWCELPTYPESER